MSQNYEKPSSMTETFLNEASGLLRQVAGNRRADESMKAVLRRVGRDLKEWSASRVRAIWYADSRIRVRADEIEYLRALVSERQEPKAEVDELVTLRTRIDRLESLLAATAPPPAGARVPAPRQQFSAVGGEPGPVD